MELIRYTEEYNKVWEEWVESSNCGVFLHSRKFLNYHKNRFEDHSLIFKNKNSVIAIIPMARESISSCMVSHPGITYGGLIYKTRIKLDDIDEIFKLILEYCRKLKFEEFIYKPIPFHIQRYPEQLDIFYLYKYGASIYSKEIWNTINLNCDRKLSKKVNRYFNKGIKNKLSIQVGDSVEKLNQFYNILIENLDKRHKTKPVHSINEFIELSLKFKNHIYLRLVTDEFNRILGGCWVFNLNNNCVHLQYIACNKLGMELNALDYLLESIIKECIANNINNFSFGSSTEKKSEILNEGLFDFKSGFGIGNSLINTYKIKL
jgi:hypothetical protein